MRQKTLLVSAATLWVLLVLGFVVARVTLLDSALSPTESAFWLLGIGGPLLMALVITRAGSSRTIAQVLYDTENPKSR